METLPQAKTVGPPPFLGSFTKGFNTVASHVWLILPPVLLDLFLWFGPHLSLQKLLSPIFAQLITDMVKSAGANLPQNFEMANELTQTMLVSSNLMTALRSYPIGVPSLMAIASPLVNALGLPVVYQVPNLQTALLIWLGLTLTGVLLGSLYFSSLAKAAGRVVEAVPDRKPVDTFGQVLIFTLLMYAVLFIVGIPILMFLGLMTLINPALGQIIFMVVFFLVSVVSDAAGVFPVRDIHRWIESDAIHRCQLQAGTRLPERHRVVHFVRNFDRDYPGYALGKTALQFLADADQHWRACLRQHGIDHIRVRLFSGWDALDADSYHRYGYDRSGIINI